MPVLTYVAVGRIVHKLGAPVCVHGRSLSDLCDECVPRHVNVTFANSERANFSFAETPPAAEEPKQDEHAYIHEMMGDASVLSDRMDYDPTALAGIVGRLVNAVTILSDQNKALAARVAALESWQRSEETAALEASERD